MQWYYGKILIVEFIENEENVFRKTVEFQIAPFTSTFINDKGEKYI